MVSIVTNGQQLGKNQKMKHCNESDETDEDDEDETFEFSSSKLFHKRKCVCL